MLHHSYMSLLRSGLHWSHGMATAVLGCRYRSSCFGMKGLSLGEWSCYWATYLLLSLMSNCEAVTQRGMSTEWPAFINLTLYRVPKSVPMCMLNPSLDAVNSTWPGCCPACMVLFSIAIFQYICASLGWAVLQAIEHQADRYCLSHGLRL